jgi:N-acetyl sugar amidotransferase
MDIKAMKRCTKGLWDETVPGILFDQDGVSNFAHLHNKLMEAYPRGNEGKEEFDDIVKKIRNSKKSKNKYDCIIGISGGTDSCYLLYIAKEVYGLNPLAVNLDNGWNSDIAVKNIYKVTKSLNIDLETYVIDYEEIKDLLRSYMIAGLPWVDIPTDMAIKSILYRIAAKEGVKYVLRGNDFRSEGSQPFEWTYGDGRQINAVHKKFGRVKLKSFPNYTIVNTLVNGVFRGIKSVYPYYYLEYKKNEAMEFLKEKFDWEYYGGHHHENHFTKFVMSYWLYEKFGIDKRLITLSAQILSGEISREQGLKDIEKKPYNPNEIGETINFVAKKLDLTKEEFDEIWNSKNLTYKDYPSNAVVIEKMTKWLKPFLKLLFLHKPQSIFKAEMNKQN